MMAMLGAMACLAALPAPAPARDSVARLSLVINIPAYRLDVRDGARIVASYPVAIGAPEYPTPVGEFLVRTIDLNPSWTPPRSPWARDRSPMPPGPANPMGRAKLMLRELYYIHGSPDSASIGRAASHGCIRVSDANMLDILRRMLEAGLPAMSPEERSALLAGRASRTVALARGVRVSVRYDLIEHVDGAVVGHPDIYRLGP